MTQLDKLYSQWVDAQPLSSDDEKRLKRKFMLDFNYNSNHIEGEIIRFHTYNPGRILRVLQSDPNASHLYQPHSALAVSQFKSKWTTFPKKATSLAPKVKNAAG